jgi:hypothetical protein
MIIRSARQKDRPAWEEMWLSYQDYFDADLSKTTQNTWQRLMSPPLSGPHILVCENYEFQFA